MSEEPLQDLMLGTLARQKGWVEPAQLGKAITEQSLREARGERVPLGALLVERGLLQSEQLQELLAQQRQYVANRQKQLYGQLAVKNKLASVAQVQAALDAQKQQPDRRIGQILVQQGVIDAQKHQALMRAIARQQVGPEDVRLGQTAVRARLIDPVQLQEALFALQEELYKGRRLDLSQLLIERKLASADQLAQLGNAELDAWRRDNRRFAAEAVRQGRIHGAEAEQLLAELDAQRAEQGAARLADRLVAAGRLSEAEREAIAQQVQQPARDVALGQGRWVVVRQDPGRPAQEFTLEHAEVVRWIDKESIHELSQIRRESEKEFQPLQNYQEFAEALIDLRSKDLRQLEQSHAIGRKRAQIRSLVGGFVWLAAGLLVLGGIYAWVQHTQRERERQRQERIEAVRLEMRNDFERGKRALERQDWTACADAFREAQKAADELAGEYEARDEAAKVHSFIVEARKEHSIDYRARGLVQYHGEWLSRQEAEERELTDRMQAEGKIYHDGRWMTPDEKVALEMQARGLVLYNGRWLSPEDKARQEKLDQGLVEYEGEWIAPAERERREADKERLAMEAKGLFPYAGKYFTRSEINELEEIDEQVKGGLWFYNGEWLPPDQLGRYARVTMASGDTFLGYYLAKSESQGEMRTAIGMTVLPAAAIQAIDDHDNEQQQFIQRYRDALLGQDVNGLLAVARWARQIKLESPARQAYQRVMRVDAANLEAAQALGLIQIGGRWVEDLARHGLVLDGERWLSKEELAYIKEGQQLYFGSWYPSVDALKSARARAAGARLELEGFELQCDLLLVDPRQRSAVLRALELTRKAVEPLLIVKRLEKLPQALYGMEYEERLKSRGEWLVPPCERPIKVSIETAELWPPLVTEQVLERPDQSLFGMPVGVLLGSHESGRCRVWDAYHPSVWLSELVHNTAHQVIAQYYNHSWYQMPVTQSGYGGLLPHAASSKHLPTSTHLALPLLLEGLAEHTALSDPRLRGLGYHDDLFRDDVHAIALIAQGQVNLPRLDAALTRSVGRPLTVADAAFAWAAYQYLSREMSDQLRWALGYQAFEGHDLGDSISKLVLPEQREALGRRFPSFAESLAERTLRQTIGQQRLGAGLSTLERRLVALTIETLFPPAPGQIGAPAADRACIGYNGLILLNGAVSPRQRRLMAGTAARMWLAHQLQLQGKTGAARTAWRDLARQVEELGLESAAQRIQHRMASLGG